MAVGGEHTEADEQAGADAVRPEMRPGTLTRRRFLETVIGAGISATAGPQLLRVGHAPAAATPVGRGRPSSRQPLPQWAMVIDLRLCDGCKACTVACQQRHYLPPEQKWIDVYTMTSAGGQQYHLPRLCMMCENPPCLAVCPVGATFRTDEGLVLVNQDVCIGCRFCMAACPYEARYFNAAPPPKVPRQPTPPTPEWPVPQQMGTVGKCVLCADRLPHGELPACVAGCPMGALYVGDLTTDVAVNGLGNVIKISQFLKANDAVRLKPELGTHPRVFYVPGHGQDLQTDQTNPS